MITEDVLYFIRLVFTIILILIILRERRLRIKREEEYSSLSRDMSHLEYRYSEMSRQANFWHNKYNELVHDVVQSLKKENKIS